MRCRSRLIFRLLWLALMVVSSAKADTVWMNNGDVLSGEITKLEAGKLSLKTKYVGTVLLDLKYVTSMGADRQLWVSLIGEKQASLRSLKGLTPGVIVIDGDGRERSFSSVWPVAGIHVAKPALADSWQLKGNLVASLDSKSGNDEKSLVGVEGQVHIDDQWNKNAVYWDLDLENDEGVKSSEWKLGYSYSRYLTEHWFVQGAAEQEYDSEEDLQTRTSLGGTLGYRFWETSQKTLRTSGGISRLWEDYQSSPSQKDYALTWGFNYRTPLFRRWDYFANSRTFFRLNQSTVLVNVTQGIKVGLTEHITWNLTHMLDYDSDPAEESKKVDNRVKMGVGYQW